MPRESMLLVETVLDPPLRKKIEELRQANRYTDESFTRILAGYGVRGVSELCWDQGIHLWETLSARWRLTRSQDRRPPDRSAKEEN
jgi:hypothetical protein